MTKKKTDFEMEANPNIPTDPKQMDLFRDAYTGKLMCFKAIIKADAIKPYSLYVPEIIKSTMDWFIRETENERYRLIFVYQEGDKFIMSDDYTAYYCYKVTDATEIPCVVLGEPIGDNVIFKGKPFVLSPPEFKLVKE